MENILLQCTDKVIRGAKFKVDLVGRNLYIDKKKVIDKGEYKGGLGVDAMTADEFKQTVTELYRNYKHSVPTETSEHKRRLYFKALPECELSDEDMVSGERRDAAQCLLELFVLCCAINGISWTDIDERNGFFWQSKEEKGLVIFREWMENSIGR